MPENLTLLSAGTTRLVLVRHGQTAANTGSLLHGRTNLPLDETGRKQAARVAVRLASVSDIKTILSSPLDRALATAEAIGLQRQLPVTQMPQLTEMDFGDFEGLSFEELFTRYPEVATRALDRNDTSLAWPNGDIVSEFHDRVGQTFWGIVSMHSGQSVIVVSHNGVLGSYLAKIRGLPQNDWQSYRLSNCGISIVDVDSEGTAHILLLDDVAHLDEALDARDTTP